MAAARSSKASSSTVRKAAPEKAVTTKKPAAKKPAAKKPAAKKPAAKKPAAKKPAAKKPAAESPIIEPSANEPDQTEPDTVGSNPGVDKTSAKRQRNGAKSGTTTSPATKSRVRSMDPTARKRSASVTATNDIPPFLADTEWLEARRAELLSERLRYTHNAEMLAAEAASLMADRDPGDVQFDEESGEGDTLAVERDRDLALSAQAREKVDEIDAALQRLDNGTYGHCVVGGMGDFIPQERLEALPMAPKCIAHQTSMF